MGCDGGTIPRRDELVRTKKKPEKKDKGAEAAAKWKHCALSQEPLRRPIVACELGRLYNKEAVIRHLLDGGSSHLAKLSDVRELQLTERREGGPGTADVYHASRFACPVTGLDMNGAQRFCFHWGCGCVVSERALRQVQGDGACLRCGQPAPARDVVLIHPTEEAELEDMRTRMEERRRERRNKKKKKSAAAATEGSAKKVKLEPGTDAAAKNPSDGTVENPAKNTSGTDKATTSGINGAEKDVNGAVKSSSEKAVNGAAKSSSEKAVNGATKNSSEKAVNGAAKTSKSVDLPKKAQSGYSIAKDPTATDAFKSLFTSHESAKRKQKQHWITHNPLYF